MPYQALPSFVNDPLSREAGQDLFLEILPYVDNGRVKKFLKFVVALSFMAHGSYQKPLGSNKQCLSRQSLRNCTNYGKTLAPDVFLFLFYFYFYYIFLLFLKNVLFSN
jgi:hypothetical protein